MEPNFHWHKKIIKVSAPNTPRPCFAKSGQRVYFADARMCIKEIGSTILPQTQVLYVLICPMQIQSIELSLQHKHTPHPSTQAHSSTRHPPLPHRDTPFPSPTAHVNIHKRAHTSTHTQTHTHTLTHTITHTHTHTHAHTSPSSYRHVHCDTATRRRCQLVLLGISCPEKVGRSLALLRAVGDSMCDTRGAEYTAS